jgi:hypothetical protein
VSHWLVDQLQLGLQLVDQPDLVRGAAEHCLLEDPDRDSRPSRRISPTLIAEECRLARIKRYRKHDPQPGWKWRATKSGRPSASSNMHTLRGMFAEGMAVTALRATGMQILGVSPTCVFEAEEFTETMYEEAGYLRPRSINWLGYPDIVFLREGRCELIQMKCPSVHAITRYKRDGSASLERRYAPQATAEMHIGRLLGMPIERNHILCFAFEGTLPGSDEAKAGRELHAVAHTVEWQDGMDAFCRRVAEEILEDDAEAERANWPAPYAADYWNKWPCSYCNYPRVSDGTQTTCEEHSAWEPQLLTPASPTTGRPAIQSPPAPASSPMTAPAPAALATPSPQGLSLAPLSRLTLPPPPPSKLR